MANALTASSGTTNFAPSLGDVVLDAYARCQVRSASLSNEHWFQARLSANLMQSEWANVGMPILAKIQPIKIVLQPGVTQYDMPSNIIAPLDATISQYQMGDGQDFAPVITGTAGSTIANVTQALHSMAAGDMAFFATAIAASGQVIQGGYLVDTVVDENNYQITLPTPMDGTDTVALPMFTTTAGSSTMSITLANHGLSIGKSFFCNVPVTIAGLTLSGQMIVQGVQDTSHFTVSIGQGAGSSTSVTMNSGQAQVKTQAPGVDLLDYILFPVSRTDWVSQPDRGPNNIFRPSTFWFQRLRNPVISFWNPPDVGPYTFTLWAMVALEDAVIPGGVGVDVTQRYYEAYAASLAGKLSIKYPPPPASGVTTMQLVQWGKEALDAALREDIERTDFFVSPGLWNYYR